ncbi:hypothetical protein GCM10008935_30160 [Alkalibacillus silvisoli]|uniref:Uncharacterized protein n=1 Tax=Alkalibacillus silvisoli TaxID=392823 RepID=A0ABP3K633_9BACI
MVLLPHEKPPTLVQLEVIVPRLTSNSPVFKSLQEQYWRDKSGFEGERSIHYYFNFLSQ